MIHDRRMMPISSQQRKRGKGKGARDNPAALCVSHTTQERISVACRPDELLRLAARRREYELEPPRLILYMHKLSLCLISRVIGVYLLRDERGKLNILPTECSPFLYVMLYKLM